MKKKWLVVSLMATMMLTACGDKTAQSNHDISSKDSAITSKKQANRSENSSASSSSEKNSQRESSTHTSQDSVVRSSHADDAISNTTMNFAQIKVGNYSSLIGKWRLLKATAHNQGTVVDETADAKSTLSVSKQTMTNDSISVNRTGLFDKGNGNGELHRVHFQSKDGALSLLLQDADKTAINWAITFYPAGTTSEYPTNQGENKNSKNTIVIWTSNMQYTEVFVEDEANASSETTNGAGIDVKDASWNATKDQQLQSFMIKFGKSMDQNYDKYDGHNELKTYTGMRYPTDLHSTVMDGQRGIVGWSSDGENNYQYNVVALYNHNPVPRNTSGRITYAFTLHKGQPIVLVDQSSNGDPTWHETQNQELRTAFTNIVKNTD